METPILSGCRVRRRGQAVPARTTTPWTRTSTCASPPRPTSSAWSPAGSTGSTKSAATSATRASTPRICRSSRWSSGTPRTGTTRDNMTLVRELFQRVLDRGLRDRRSSSTAASRWTSPATGPCSTTGSWCRRRPASICGRSAISKYYATSARDCPPSIWTHRPTPALVDLLYKKTVRPDLVQPCFLVAHPAELVPLARRSDEDPTRLDMFQVVANSWELVKAYSELVDPVEQRRTPRRAGRDPRARATRRR